jgi:hypothetical protein
MKRLVVFLCVSALVFAVATPLMAGGIENKHNYSAEYIRTLNRNAATDSADAVVYNPAGVVKMEDGFYVNLDSADAVVYNPAGVVKMEDGFYVNLSGQYAFKDYSNTVGGTEFDQDEPDIVPSLFALFFPLTITSRVTVWTANLSTGLSRSEALTNSMIGSLPLLACDTSTRAESSKAQAQFLVHLLLHRVSVRLKWSLRIRRMDGAAL